MNWINLFAHAIDNGNLSTSNAHTHVQYRVASKYSFCKEAFVVTNTPLTVSFPSERMQSHFLHDSLIPFPPRFGSQSDFELLAVY